MSEEVQTLRNEEQVKLNLSPIPKSKSKDEIEPDYFDLKKEKEIDSEEDNISQNSLNFTVSKAADISCKYHGKQYIGVDTGKFILICKQCQSEGKRRSFLDYNGEKNERDYFEDEDYYCSSHPESKGVFYCEDCKYFICKLCFANTHRQHNSNIPNVMAEEFKNKIIEVIGDLNKMQPIIIDALNGINMIYQEMKKMRDDSVKKIKDMVKNVSDTHKFKIEKLEESLKLIFLGLDGETEDAYNRLNIILKKINKYLSELDEVIFSLESKQNNPIAFCEFKKSKLNLFKDINNLINESKRMLDYKVESIKTQANNKLDTFKKQVETLTKQIIIFEKSLLTSITSGVTSSNYVLRRFTKFNSKGLKYFKTSSIIMRVNKGIFLSGLGLCGIYLSSVKGKSGEKSGEEIPIVISISEIKEGGNISKISENHKIKFILNRFDPIFLTYFKKGIYLKSDIDYLITIQNKDKNCYLDIWCGEVSKKYLEPVKPKITCNSTNIEFLFNQAEGYESDFNEFNSGIIGGVIYSYVKSN